MNILFLSSKSLYPLKDGHTTRSYNILKRVAQSHQVYFLTFFQDEDEKRYFSEITKICAYAKGFSLPYSGSRLKYLIALIKNVFTSTPFVAQKFYSKEMAEEIEGVLRTQKIDLIHVDILPLMSFAESFNNIPVVLVEHNVESLLLQRRTKYAKNLFLRLFLKLQCIKLFRFEKTQVSGVKCCIAVSEQESKIIKSFAPQAKVEMVPNGVDIGYFTPQNGHSETKSLVFLGSLTWFANLDGMRFFCDEILPEIKRLAGNVPITVIGKVNKRFSCNYEITQTGFVNDVRPYLQEASVLIVPLRIGGGTRLKILDAMAMGKAIVSTSIGCEGLEVENGKHLIIKDNQNAFAKEVVELLVNKEKREIIGRNARRLTEEKYDWDIIAKVMNGIYRKAAG